MALSSCAESPNTLASVILLDEGGEVAELSADLDRALDIFHAGVVPEGETPPVHGIDVASQRVGGEEDPIVQEVLTGDRACLHERVTRCRTVGRDLRR